jgi:hypothetical protein
MRLGRVPRHAGTLMAVVAAVSLASCGGASSEQRTLAKVSNACRPIIEKLEAEQARHRPLASYLRAALPLLQGLQHAEQAGVHGASPRWLQPLSHVEEARNVAASQLAGELEAGDHGRDTHELADSVAELHMDAVGMTEEVGATGCAYWPLGQLVQ